MYDITDERKPVKKKDPASEALDQEEEDLAREARRLRLEALVVERRKKIQSLQGGEQTMIQGGTGTASPAASLIMMLAAQGLEPGKANDYIKALDNESIMKLSMIGAQNQNALLPLILLGSKQGTSVEEIVKLVGAIIAIAKPSGEGGDMMTKLVTETIPNMQKEMSASRDLAYQTQIQALQARLEEIKPMDPADYVKKVADAASALGMRSGADTSLEVEKLRLEDAREVRRIDADRDNTREIIGTVKDLIEGRAGDVLAKIGDAGAERIRGGKGTQAQGGIPPSAETSQMLMVQCGKCGGTFKASSDAKTVKCPHCGSDLKVEFKPPAQEKQEQEEQVSRVPEFGGGIGELTPRWSGPPEKE